MIDDISYVKAGLNKKKIIILILLYVLLWYFNYCTPLIFDDYVYSFSFSERSMLVPLPETANRVESVTDIFVSQWNHYFSWGGRTVAHTLVQLFLWQGKLLFNIANAACFIFLLLEISWIINRGKMNFRFSEQDILYVFGLLWFFSIGLGDVFVWLTLACNYLWTTVILLGFLLIYINHFFNGTVIIKNKALIIGFGLLAGWTNENTICFVILVLTFYLFNLHKSRGLSQKERSLLYGLAGLYAGYLMLMLAPGNYVRFIRETNAGVLLSGAAMLQRNLVAIVKILALRCILYVYVFKNLIVLNRCRLEETEKKTLSLALAFTFLSFCSLAIMVFSPEFRFRSSFPGLIFLIIAVGLVRNIVCTSKQSLLNNNRNSFYGTLQKLTTAYICLTLIGSIYVYSFQHQQTQAVLAEIEKEKNNPTGNTLVVKERPYRLNDYRFFNAITGFHLVFPYSIMADAEHWINKDVALYYGIKSIRTEEKEDVWR